MPTSGITEDRARNIMNEMLRAWEQNYGNVRHAENSARFTSLEDGQAALTGLVNRAKGAIWIIGIILTGLEVYIGHSSNDGEPLMYTYSQSTGELAQDGQHLATGYSGRDSGLNNPGAQQQVGVGPLPQGLYTIGPAYDNPHTGPITLNLEPDPANQMFGRSLFRIHGDTAAMNHTASDGCIILPKVVRLAINAGLAQDNQLTVTG